MHIFIYMVVICVAINPPQCLFLVRQRLLSSVCYSYIVCPCPIFVFCYITRNIDVIFGDIFSNGWSSYRHGHHPRVRNGPQRSLGCSQEEFGQTVPKIVPIYLFTLEMTQYEIYK